MSGGAFDYWQYHLTMIADQIQEKIDKNNEKPTYFGAFSDDGWEGQMYSDDTIEEFKKAIRYLKIAEVYAQRVDWLISGDDGEEEFHRRLKEDLKEIGEKDVL